VAIMADNCAKYLETYFAATKLGMSVTPLNVRLGDDEIVSVVNDSESTVFIVGDGYEERVADIRGKLSSVERYLAFGNPFPGFDAYEALLAHACTEEPDADLYDVDEDDLAILMYTGGTTGAPKGVMLSHRNALLSGIAAALHCGLTKDDSTCFVLPIFHVSWWPVLMILLIGGKVCINRKPDLDIVFRLIQDEKCTHLNLVPTIYAWMVNYPNVDQYDLSSVRLFTYAGSPFPLQIEIRNAFECPHPRHSVLVEDALHPVGQRKANSDLTADRQLAQVRQFHRSASWYSTSSPSAMRLAISS